MGAKVRDLGLTKEGHNIRYGLLYFSFSLIIHKAMRDSQFS